MHGGLRAIALAAFAMALRAFIHVNSPGSSQRGLRGRQRILHSFDFLWYNPRFVVLESSIDNRNTSKGQKHNEKNFARLEIGLRVGGHRHQENSRTSRRSTEATRQRSCRPVLLFGTEDEPDQLGVKEENGSRNNPCDDLGEARICEFAHLGAVARKLDQRNDRERQLKAENHLAEN